MKSEKSFDSSVSCNPDGNAVIASTIAPPKGANTQSPTNTIPAFVGVFNTSASAPAIQRPLTANELAAMLPLHPVTILRWAREGRIPHRRLSARKVLFLPTEINAWLASGSAFYTEHAVCAAQPERMAA